ncbi:MAG TPA: DUF305 domain-containing protein [Rubrobacteraceae bacterium]|nr:DUF305 domain-containing protein [Rubrobacteraceae bacterium]
MRGKSGASPLLLAVLAGAVIVLFGLSVWLWLAAREPGTDSAEAGFARDMITHHAQAVEMAEIIRDATENDRINTLATDITLTQQAQIGQMQGWLNIWGLPVAGTEPPMAWMDMSPEGIMPGMASREEINRLRDLPPEEADRLFLQLMIPHHEAAIPMSNAVLERTSNPAVEKLASSIVASQEAEISIMQEMLRDIGASPVEEEESMDMEGMDMSGQE